MAPVLHFTDWKYPLLRTAVDFLVANHPPESRRPLGLPVWDLSRVFVVTPTSRSGRRLLELLADRAQEPGSPCVLTPPAILTPGSIIQALSPPKSRTAGRFETALAWMRAVRQVRMRRGRNVPLPEPTTVREAFLNARVLADIRAALSAEGLDMRCVERVCRSRRGFKDERRWSVLAEIESEYLATLDAGNLQDPDSVADRAISAEDLPDAVVCVGVPEAPRTFASLLERLPIAVTCLVYAPISHSDAFDRLGCVRPEVWSNRHITLRDDRIRLVGQPREQARAALDAVSEWADRMGPDEIVIGLGDLQLQSSVLRDLEEASVPVHAAYARPLASARPIQFLSLLAAYLNGGDAEAFATLARHPDLDRALRGTVDATAALSDLDALRMERLPSHIAGRDIPQGAPYPRVSRLLRAVERTFGPLRGGQRPISEWAEPIARALSDAYDADVLGATQSGLDADPPDTHDTAARGRTPELRQSLEATGALLRDLAGTVPGLASEMTVVAPDAIGVLAQAARSVALSEPYGGPAVEIVDWFELHTDDAPVKIVVGMNEGCVPERTPRDPYLTDALRAELGMPTAAHRYARDAYVLTALCAGPADVTLIAGRTAADGEPALPSRLLLAAEDQVLVDRGRRFFATSDAQDSRPPVLYAPAHWTRYSPIRPKPPEPPLAELRVTAFRDYLACPYRFYLKHVLKLEAVSDRAEELGAAPFGSLLHEVVCHFLRHPDSGHLCLEDAKRLVGDILDQVARRRLGIRRLGAVELQLALMRRRLERFVASRLDDRALGWRTRPEWVEAECDCDMAVDGTPFRIHGRIDCLDYNEDSGLYRILDFKSSDSEPSPERKHRRSLGGVRVWVDLQLPLYRLMAPCPPDASPSLAFLWLTPDPGTALVRPAQWNADDLDEADECARSVIRSVRDGVYWPPTQEVPSYDDGLAHLCMDRCSERHALLRNPPAPWDEPCAA